MNKKEYNNFINEEIMEGMSSISALIHSIDGMNPTNNRKILEIFIDENKRKSKKREIAFLKAKALQYNFKVNFVSSAEIDALTSGQTHGGIVAKCTPRTFSKLNEDMIDNNGIYYYLEGVEDPYNFGYAVRSLYASGASGLVLSPRNWMGVAGLVARSSAGTSELLNMYISDPLEAIDIFKSKGYTVVCAGIRNSVSIFNAELKKPLFVILGGEKRGISSAVLEKADKVVRIDYGANFSGSLSTSAAAAVFGFEILRQNQRNI